MKKELIWRDIKVFYDKNTLEFSNSFYRRKFDLSSGTLRTSEFVSAKAGVLCEANVNASDLECYGSWLTLDKLDCRMDPVHIQVVEEPELDSPHVRIEVVITEPHSRTVLRRIFFLYPEIAAYGLQNKVICHAAPAFFWQSRKGVRCEYAEIRREAGVERYNEPLMDVFHPADGFTVKKTVEFFGHTDIHDHPVVEHPFEAGEHFLTGNLLYCENTEGAGVVMLQEAPPSSERREREEYDFRLDDKGDIFSICWGILPEELMANAGKEMVSYRNMVGVYHDAYSRDRVLKDYLRVRFDNAQPSRRIVVNAWGCGDFGKRLSPEFLAAEIRASKDCGGEVYQVDDQWQSGGSLGELALKNVSVPLEKFWGINEEKVGRGGFDRLRKIAEENGISLALWLAPSTNIFYRDHREFAEMILQFHRRYGFELFKLDNAGFQTYEAERNFEKILCSVRRETANRVFFNLDITAGLRGGFFRLLEYGSLFVENRYACSKWGLGYHPERTLRNLWHLAHYVRLQNLQMEIASPFDINLEAYTKRGETSPDVYGWQYWAAVTLFTNPLLWFAPSSVPEERRHEVAEIMSLHKRYRDLIFSGEISPVGDKPTGSALTGFVSRDAEGKILAVLLLREREAQRSSLELAADLVCAAGAGRVADSTLEVTVRGGFALFVKPEL